MWQKWCYRISEAKLEEGLQLLPRWLELNTLGQQSPTFLALETGFVEDSFSTDGGEGGSGGNVSDGERQMKLHLPAHRSSPAVQPGSL